MRISGVEWREGGVALVTVEVDGTVVRPIEAGLVAEDEVKSRALGERIVAVSPAEACFHVSVPVPGAVKLPDVQNFGEIASLTSVRPGGEKQAVCARQHGDRADVGIVNLTSLGEHDRGLATILDASIDMWVERVMAWHALALHRRQSLPDVVIDCWASPASLLIFSDTGEPLAAKIEPLPGATVAAQLQAALAVLKPALSLGVRRTLGMVGGAADDLTKATALFGPLELDVERLWGDRSHLWSLALGAILQAIKPTHRFAPVTIAL